MIGFVGFVIIVIICHCGDEDREHDHDHGDEDHDGRLYKFDTLVPGLRNFAILHAHGIISLAPLLRFNLNL